MKSDLIPRSTCRRLGTLAALLLLIAVGCGGGSGPTSPQPSQASQVGGGEQRIRIEKTTNGADADFAENAPRLPVGSAVTWRYTISNPGSGELTEIRLRDDRIGPISCDIRSLGPGESRACSATGTASTRGLYRNVATVEAVFRISPTGFSQRVEASDASHYFGFEEDGSTRGGKCGIGYWKNHLQDWPPTGYSPSQSVVSVFSDAAEYPSVAAASLLEALRFGGGPGEEGGARNLLRHGVAALLNASHPALAYPKSSSAVIDEVNDALRSGDRQQMLRAKGQLASAGNGPCSLGGS